jgi:hypothetical protein
MNRQAWEAADKHWRRRGDESSARRMRHSQIDGLVKGHRLEERDVAVGWDNPGSKIGHRNKIQKSAGGADGI